MSSSRGREPPSAPSAITLPAEADPATAPTIAQDASGSAVAPAAVAATELESSFATGSVLFASAHTPPPSAVTPPSGSEPPPSSGPPPPIPLPSKGCSAAPGGELAPAWGLGVLGLVCLRLRRRRGR